MNRVNNSMSILVVCLGNLCRSPAAEYLLRNEYLKYQKASSESPQFELIIDSAGLSPAGYGMDPLTERYLEIRGMDPTPFRNRSIPYDPLSRYDWILVMDEYMKDQIVNRNYTSFKFLEHDKYRRATERIILFSEAAGRTGKIIDPYGMPELPYFKIMQRIEKDAHAIIARLYKQNSLIG